MKEMVYYPTRLEKPILLLDTYIDEYRILIYNLGTHPCGYVEVPINHPLAGFDYEDLPIECHGGLTFSEKGDGKYFSEEYWWYGWDYAHWGDYISGTSSEYDKKWTTQEIFEEAKYVVSQMKFLNEFILKLFDPSFLKFLYKFFEIEVLPVLKIKFSVSK